MARLSHYDDLPDDDSSMFPLRDEQKLGKRRRRSKRFAEELIDPRDLPVDAFTPTYSGSRHELHWILTYLTPFYEDDQLLDVLFRVKGGKEANVYCCRAHPSLGVELVAAKLYRPRMFRNLRNDAAYREGRAVLDPRGQAVLDARSLRAIKKGTAIGQELIHTSWLSHEYHTLRHLHEIGVDVPRPYAIGENVILMEYLGDEAAAAPALYSVRLEQAEAERVFERLIDDVERMLQAGHVHGDLSAYNVLYWEGRSTIIDVPQAFDPIANTNAFPLFSRDVERLCQYFARYGLRHDGSRLAAEIWSRVLPGLGAAAGALPGGVDLEG